MALTDGRPCALCPPAFFCALLAVRNRSEIENTNSTEFKLEGVQHYGT